MSNTIFHIIPTDISINHILPKLNAAETGRFSWVSKHTQLIVSITAGNQHDDITLEGKCTRIVPGTITAFLHLKLRNDIFANFERLTMLTKLAEGVQATTGNPLDITAYVDLAKGNEDNTDDAALLKVIVPFDFDKKQIEANGKTGLVNVLLEAINEESEELIRGVLAHPNAKDIPVVGNYSLRTALAHAMETGNPKVIRAVLAHPKIPGDGANGLMDALGEVIKEELPVELIGAIFSHPNASNVKTDSPFAPLMSFESAVDDNKTAYVEAFLSTPKFLADGQTHIGAALYYAVFNKNTHLIKLLVDNHRAKDIPVDDNHGGLRSIVQTAFAHAKAEPEFLRTVLVLPNIPADGEYGLGHLLIQYVVNPDWPTELLESILSHPNAENIPIPANASLHSVGQALKFAESKNRPDLAKLISSRFKV
jgi:hypothetical protein